MIAKQICESIISNKMSNDDLNLIVDAIKFARHRLIQQAKSQLRIGDRVKWTSTSSPGRGVIKKIAIKYVIVDTGIGLYKVPANKLEKD